MQEITFKVTVTVPDHTDRYKVRQDVKTSIGFGNPRIVWLYTVQKSDPRPEVTGE